MIRTTLGRSQEFVFHIFAATMADLIVSKPVATSDDLADHGFKAEYFDYPRLLRSEQDAQRGKHRPLPESLADLRARHDV